MNIKKVLLYFPIFNTGSAKEQLNFLGIPKKIIKVHNLNTGTHYYAMANNILFGEAVKNLYKKLRKWQRYYH